MRLGTVISHPSLGKKVYLSQLLTGGVVRMVDCQSTCVNSDWDTWGHLVYIQDLASGTIQPEGWSKSTAGREKDLARDTLQAKPLTTLTVARLLDESVDSKQLFQALSDEGIALKGYEMFRNYLGKWKLKDKNTGDVYPITKLLSIIEHS